MFLIQIFAGLFLFFLGTIIGSFLNVIIYRQGSGKHIGGRSRCLSCGKQLNARMLIPLLSFIFMKGRCGFCKTKLSLQYPIIEAISGAMFVLIGIQYDVLGFFPDIRTSAMMFIDAIVWSLLIVITAYDIRHKIIPDLFSILLAVVAGIALYIKSGWGVMTLPHLPFLDFVPWWINWASALFVSAPFALLWFFSGGRAMGLGDAKLAWGIAWFLGFGGGFTAVILSFWIAFFPSLLLLFLQKKHFTMKSEIPFAPFLVLGAFTVYVFHINILAWSF